MISLLNRGFDSLTACFAGFNPVLALVVISIGSAFVLLSVFKRFSNQEMIQLHKAVVFGNFLEIAIYRDQFRRIMICLWRVLKHNCLYIRYFIPPILIMMIPMGIICLQLEYRLGYEPIKVGQSFIIEARLNDKTALDKAQISTSGNIDLETPALHDVKDDLVFWRAIIKKSASRSFVRISLPGHGSIIKGIAVAGAPLPPRFTPEKNRGQTFADLISSGESSIPASSLLSSIRVDYPAARYSLLNLRLSPIVYFFVLTLFCGLILKPILKVQI